MDLVLINAPLQNTGESSTIPPLGILYLVSYLREKGIRAEFVDLNFAEDAEKLSRIIAHLKTRIFAVSCFTSNRMQTYDVIRKIRNMAEDAVIIVGGVHATFLNKQLLEHFPVDIVVNGEAEETLLKLVSSLRCGEDISPVKGITYKKDGRIVTNPKRSLIQNLDELPWPAWDLVDFGRYSFYEDYFCSFGIELPGKGTVKGASILTSRGCSFECSYCSISAFWERRCRHRCISDVVEEMSYLKNERGRNFFFFWDDIFTMKRDRVSELCDRLIRQELNVYWGCITRVDLVDEDLLTMMKKAGCLIISYGVESGHERILKNINKGISTKQIEECIALTKRIGMKVRVSLMIGNKGEDDDTIATTIDLLTRIKPDAWSVNLTTVYPNTSLYYELLESGHIDMDYWVTNSDVPLYDYGTPKSRLLAWKVLTERSLRGSK